MKDLDHMKSCLSEHIYKVYINIKSIGNIYVFENK